MPQRYNPIGETGTVPPDTPVVPLAGVFGGGGLFGIGYAMGVIDGLRTRGVDLTGCPMLGTSAGSWAASATALGIPFTELISLDVPKFPNPRPGILAASAREVFGDAVSSHVHVVVTEIPRLRRVVLSGEATPLAELVAASSAVPGLLAPQTINGKRYVDGGVRSGVSVDLADAAEVLVLITPLAGAMFGPFGRLVESRTNKEQAIWSQHNTGRFIEFSPSKTTSGLATRPQHLFDRDRGIEAYQHGINEALKIELPQ